MTIHKVINTDVEPVHSIFQNSLGFVLPEYQRSYMWNKENVNQLVRDINLSLTMFQNSSHTDNEIRFLGSIITIVHDKQFSRFGSRAPVVAHEIVDGQQRLTTFMLVALVLWMKLNQSKKAIDENPEFFSSGFDDLKNILDYYIEKLKSTFVTSVNIQGMKTDLPFMIRSESDAWEDYKNSYESEVAKAIWDYIKSDDFQFIKPKNKSDLVGHNIKVISVLLDQIAENKQPGIDTDEYGEVGIFSTMDVLSRINDLWKGSTTEFVRRVRHEEYLREIGNPFNAELTKMSRMLIFSYYFLNKCYLNHISTRDERWAFDMFIGLNTVGIPLSAVETFRAYLIEKTKPWSQTKNNLREEIKKVFTNKTDGIQLYFDQESKLVSKEKRIKEFVTTFGLYFSGQKIGFNIHEQRNYLKQALDNQLYGLPDHSMMINKHGEFLKKLSQLTKYLIQQDDLLNSRTSPFQLLTNIEDSDKDTVLLCIAFLYDVNHSIIDAVAARFYDSVIERKEHSNIEFVGAIKAMTAFFSLWRTVRGTSGLPDVYRSYMDKFGAYVRGGENFNLADFKIYLRHKLLNNEGDTSSINLLDKQRWVQTASSMIRYKKMKDICRFILLMTSHETTSDLLFPGLVVKASPGYQQYASFTHWRSKELKSIEHIAPQNPPKSPDDESNWDSRLYNEDALVDSLGNLVLMPLELNISGSNSPWGVKWVYYKYLALVSPDKRSDFEKVVARDYGIVMQKNTIKELKNATYAGHMQHIVDIGYEGVWSKELVEARTERMLNIFHDRMLEWLN